MKIKETLEYFNQETKEVVKKKSHKIDAGCFVGEEMFKYIVDEFLKKHKNARHKQGGALQVALVEREDISSTKSVITCGSIFTFEYAQRWTYELIV